jgi:hypothetical protein
MDFLRERIVCDDFLKFLVALVETRELTEFGIPPKGLIQAALLQIFILLLSQLHHCHKLAVDDDIYNRDAWPAYVGLGIG